MGVCLRLHPGLWPQGEGWSAVWCGGRWRVLPLGRMKRGGPPGRGRPDDADGSGRHASKPWGVRLQGEGRPALWLGGGRMRAGWDGGRPPRAGLCAGGRTKPPLCVRWPSGCRASCWRLRATVLRPGGCRGAVCSPRFGCGQGRRPEGRRRRSSGQTGSGLGRRLSGRRSRSGGLRGAAQAQAVRRAGRQSGRRRQRGSGVQPRARKPGDGGGTAAWSAATPFRFSAQHDGG